MDLGDDQFVVFNGASGFSLVVHGKPRWFGDLVEWRAVRASGPQTGDPALAMLEGQELPIQAFALDANPEHEDTALDGSPAGRVRVKVIGYKWCSNWRDDGGCHVGQAEIVGLRGNEPSGCVASTTTSSRGASNHSMPSTLAATTSGT